MYMHSLRRVQRITIDTTNAYTDLCLIGKIVKTDKCPYLDPDVPRHRHPYTGVYAMLFAPMKNSELEFAEIGIAGANSVILWWNYFTKANFSFFDNQQEFIDHARRIAFQSRTPTFSLMDVGVDGNITKVLSDTGKIFDVIVDDSSHKYEDQIRIIKESFPFVKSGGYIIIEDIYRNVSELQYEKDLVDIISKCSIAYFIICNHEERYSPGWNNDKLFVLVKE